MTEINPVTQIQLVTRPAHVRARRNVTELQYDLGHSDIRTIQLYFSSYIIDD